MKFEGGGQFKSNKEPLPDSLHDLVEVARKLHERLAAIPPEGDSVDEPRMGGDTEALRNLLERIERDINAE